MGLVIPFTIGGTLWGLASAVFLVSRIGYEGPTDYALYFVFFPAYLDAMLFMGLQEILGIRGPSGTPSGVALLVSPAILFGLLIGLIAGLIMNRVLKHFGLFR